MALLLGSLRDFGDYDGDVCVISRDDQELQELGDDVLRKDVEAFDRVDFVGARFSIATYGDLQHFAPIVYIDLDVVVDQPIELTLIKTLLGGNYSAQIESFNPLPIAVPSGAALFLEENTNVEGLFGFNAGILAMPSMVQAAADLNLMRSFLEAYLAQHGRASLQWNDQAIANYLLRKLGTFDSEPLTSATRVPLPVGPLDPRGALGFVHFWPYDGQAAKAAAMEEYVAALVALRSGEAEEGAAEIAPIDNERSDAG